MIGGELGLRQAGKRIVWGDRDRCTEGAFGGVGFGIGRSEVEDVLGRERVWEGKGKRVEVKVNGKKEGGVYGKEIVL
ncbi:aconitase family protein, partial [Priestia megaterium]|uniref:aconitase family protein n=1 Tax=Priestia megaterium TaxID=1404 RepID=UPI0021C17D02